MRVLPADVYDTLEFSALVYGGIGGGSVYDYSSATPEDFPYCLVGHAIVAANNRGTANPILLQTSKAGIGVLENDDAVTAINRRKGASGACPRVTFREWCKELGVVRGE